MQRTVLLSQFCLSACQMRVNCDKRNNRLSVSQHVRNNDISSLFTTTRVAGNCPLPPEIFAENDPPPSENADFDRFPLITSQS